jgi:predicted Zn-dependent protease
MMFRSHLRVTLILAVALGTAGSGYYAWKKLQERDVIHLARPATPDLRNWPEEFTQRIAKANRNSAGGLVDLSRLYHANGFLTEAARCYATLERLQPDEPRWLHRHATILAGFGEVEPAVRRWQRTKQLAPSYLPARIRLADILAKVERGIEATREYLDVLQRDPDHPHALLGLARLEVDGGRWDEARKHLEAAAARTNNNVGADLLVTVYEHFNLPAQAAAIRARAKAAGSFRDAADPWLDELIADCFDAYRLSLAAGLAHRSGDTANAVRLLERAVSLAPSDVTIRYQLAGVFSEQGNVIRARTELERCTSIAPRFPDAWAHLAALLERAGDRRGAEHVITRGLQQCPDSPGLHLMRARQLRDFGQPAEAIEAFRASIRLRPNEADAYLELATVLFRLERVPEGLVELERALAAEPNHPMALALLAFHAISNRNEIAAQKWLTAVTQQPRVPREQLDALLAGYREQFGRSFR